MIEISQKDKKKPKIGSFQSLGLEKELLNGLSRMGYQNPTPVQRKALPVVIAGLDVVCMARTGSGKTCAFLLPMLQRLAKHKSDSGVRGLVLSPTRELAVQTFKFASDMAKFTDLRIVKILGGDPIEAQFENLASRPDIIIATPGRLMHHLREISSFKLNHIQYLVFDEADRLFEMGFAEQLHEIIRECPKERQTLLFSATMPKMLAQFTRAGLRDPQLIRLDTDCKLSEELRIGFFCLRSGEKLSALLYLVRNIIPSDQATIIFTATRHHSEMIHYLFNKIGITSTIVYGSMDQDARSINLKSFRQGEIQYLIVTDIAARGIDVPLLNNVINFHFPASPKLFVHRCGRAARQGRVGFAFSLVEPDELGYMVDVHTFLNKEILTGYEGETEKGGDNGEVKLSYDLKTMTPEMVHSGVIPQDVIDVEQDFLNRCVADEDTLQILLKVCDNGMKQYKRTRTEASRNGIKVSKQLTKNGTLQAIHPLIAGCDPDHCQFNIVEKNNFVKMLQTFRPKQTILETGIGTGSNLKGKNASVKLTQSAAAMKALRLVTKSALERNLVRKTENENLETENDNEHQFVEENEIESENADDGDDESLFNEENEGDKDIYQELDENKSVSQTSRRLTAAERRKLKKTGKLPERSRSSEELFGTDEFEAVQYDEGKKENEGLSHQDSNKYRDKRFYMSYGDEIVNGEEDFNSSQIFAEESMQPMSGLRQSENQNARMMEQAMLDLSPEDALQMNKKKKITRWDPKKRKFVKQTLSEMAEVQKKGEKRMRSESGVGMTRTSNKPQGEMYEKWKKRTKREIGDLNPETDHGNSLRGPNVKVNKNVKDELRNIQDLRKLKRDKADKKLKNMKKDKRSKIEGKSRKLRRDANDRKQMMSGPGKRKMKVIIRK